MVDMKRCACKCPHMDSLRYVYAYLLVLTLVIIVVTVINFPPNFSNPHNSQLAPTSCAFVDARDTNDRFELRKLWTSLVLPKRFSSSSPQLQSTIFDQLLIAEGEDKGLMRDAFKELQMATSPSDRDRWTISDDRKGIERKFEFKSFVACWVRLDPRVVDMCQYRDIVFMRVSQSRGHGRRWPREEVAIDCLGTK